MRDRISEIITLAKPGDKLSSFYDIFLMIVAILSLVPMMFKADNEVLDVIDHVTVYILFFDYILRWLVYDKISHMKRPWAFILYPITPMAILDMASLLPSLGLLGHGFRILRIFRLFKVLRTSKSFMRIVNAFKKEKRTLMTVLFIALVYIFISALIMFAYEPDTFNSFFDTLYWATTALTTVGYGDIAPKSDIGRLISMISSLFGIAVIALPAGIITSSFLDDLSKNRQEDTADFLHRIKNKLKGAIYEESAVNENKEEENEA